MVRRRETIKERDSEGSRQYKTLKERDSMRERETVWERLRETV